jgi:hypothetical protein
MSSGEIPGAAALPGECMHILESTVNCTALLCTSTALQPVVQILVTFNAFCGVPPGRHATVAANFGALNRVSNSPGLPKRQILDRGHPPHLPTCCTCGQSILTSHRMRNARRWRQLG